MTSDPRHHDDESNGHTSLPNGWPELPVVEPEDDEAFALVERPSVLITGACGNLGRKLRTAWGERFDLVLLDLDAKPDDPKVIAADLAEPDESWMSYFHGVDAVVHLAANPDPKAPWAELVGPNVDAMANVLHAAVLAAVERVVFASSCHVMGGYLDVDDGPIDEDLPPIPDGPYGASKLVGERLGRSFAASFDLEFVALRIGWVQRGENRPETLAHDWARSLWLSNRDLVHLAECALAADLDETGFLVVNGTSNNRGSRWTPLRAIRLMNYMPRDDAFGGPS